MTIAIVLGSESDRKIFQESGLCEVLDFVNVSYSISIISAHRHPEEIRDFCSDLLRLDVGLVITGAGMAAQLGGVMASLLKVIPVIAVALPSPEFPNALDALLAITRMPGGCALAVTGIGKAGFKNAAILAVQIMGCDDKTVRIKLAEYLQTINPEPLVRLP